MQSIKSINFTLLCVLYTYFQKRISGNNEANILGTLVDSSDQEPDEDHEVDHNDIEH